MTDDLRQRAETYLGYEFYGTDLVKDLYAALVQAEQLF